MSRGIGPIRTLLVIAMMACVSCQGSKEAETREGEEERVVRYDQSLGTPGIELATRLALQQCGLRPAGEDIELIMAAALNLTNVKQYIRNQAPFREPGPEPVKPEAGIHHPYEWDSMRSAERMLTDRDGGSGGTQALSVAAIMRQAGVMPDDIWIVGGVVPHHYAEICPYGANSEVALEHHPAMGHTFLLVRLSDRNWYLVNSSYDPSGSFGEMGQAGCHSLPDFEMSTGYETADHTSFAGEGSFLSPREIDEALSEGPVVVDLTDFPSLIETFDRSVGARQMQIFKIWRYEEYPIHTFAQRLNLVASGDVTSNVCRWDPRESIESRSLDPLLPDFAL